MHVADHTAEFDVIVAGDVAKRLMKIEANELFSSTKKLRKKAEAAGLKVIGDLQDNVEMKIGSMMLGEMKCFVLKEGDVVKLGRGRGRGRSEDDDDDDDDDESEKEEEEEEEENRGKQKQKQKLKAKVKAKAKTKTKTKAKPKATAKAKKGKGKDKGKGGKK